MCISAYCPECRALWTWLFPTLLRCCRCPACRHRLEPADRARRWQKRHEIPEYRVGSFDVDRNLPARRRAS